VKKFKVQQSTQHANANVNMTTEPEFVNVGESTPIEDVKVDKPPNTGTQSNSDTPSVNDASSNNYTLSNSNKQKYATIGVHLFIHIFCMDAMYQSFPLMYYMQNVYMLSYVLTHVITSEQIATIKSDRIKTCVEWLKFASTCGAIVLPSIISWLIVLNALSFSVANPLFMVLLFVDICIIPTFLNK
jgi:hypothetical protein